MLMRFSVLSVSMYVLTLLGCVVVADHIIYHILPQRANTDDAFSRRVPEGQNKKRALCLEWMFLVGDMYKACKG